MVAVVGRGVGGRKCGVGSAWGVSGRWIVEEGVLGVYVQVGGREGGEWKDGTIQ